MAEALSVHSAHGLPAASGRYTVYGEIAAGGMATIQYGRLIGPAGFVRDVAIKRLHAQFARDPEFVAMFLEEARLAARIAHANVVPTLDVLSSPDEVSVVMEYVHGESLAGLLALGAARGSAVPVRVATTLLAGVLHGLHAAHETRAENGEPLHIVHRDVSPQNILVGSDGIARLLDFGIAQTRVRSGSTPTGELKGKLAYMACEQYRGEAVDRRVDVYGASVVLWEALTGQSLFDGPSDAAIAGAVMNREVPPPSQLIEDVPAALDRIVLRGLSRERTARFETAREMALALEREVGVVAQSQVSDWVHSLAGGLLAARADALRQMQQRVEARGAHEPIEAGTRRIDPAPRPSSGRRAVAQASDRDALVAFDPSGSGGAALRRRFGPVWARVLLLALLLAGAFATARVLRDDAVASTRSAAAGSSAAQTLAPARAGEEHAEAQPAAASLADLSQQVAPVAAAAAAEPAKVAAAPASTAPAAEAAPAESARASRTPGAKQRKARARAGAAPDEPSPRASAAREDRAAKARKRADCAQPFIVDPMGIRRVKRECL